MNKKTIKKFYEKHKIAINIAAAGSLVAAGYFVGDHFGYKAGLADYQEELLKYAKELGSIAHDDVDGKFVLKFFPKGGNK